MRSRFPRRPWLVVMSKSDLDIPASVLSQMPEGYLPVSVTSGENVEELKQRIGAMLVTDLRQMLAEIEKMKATAEDQQEQDEEDEDEE